MFFVNDGQNQLSFQRQLFTADRSRCQRLLFTTDEIKEISQSYNEYILNQVIVFFLNKHETNLKLLYMMDRTSLVFNDNCSQQTEVVTLSTTSVHER